MDGEGNQAKKTPMTPEAASRIQRAEDRRANEGNPVDKPHAPRAQAAAAKNTAEKEAKDNWTTLPWKPVTCRLHIEDPSVLVK